MERIGVRELRQNASVYLRRVKSGESIEVTERGEVVAQLIPPPRIDGLARLRAEGRLIEATGDLLDGELVVLPKGGATLSEALAELREDER